MRNRTIAALAVMFTLSAPASAGGILVFDTVNMLEQAKQSVRFAQALHCEGQRFAQQ